MLSVTLSGQTYRYPGAPLPDSSSVSQASISVDAASKDLETITLALRTLGSFDFSGHSLHEFVRESVVLYLEDDHMEVRQAAAQTCCHLLARDNTVVRGSSSRTTQIVGDVLEKLLIVGITDPGRHRKKKNFFFFCAISVFITSLFAIRAHDQADCALVARQGL